MKKEVIFFVFILLVGIVSGFETTNVSLDEEYSPYEILKGEFYAEIINENADGLLTSNLEGNISLVNFLIKNGVDYSCIPDDCSLLYEKSVEGYEFEVDNDTYAGFYFEGEDVEVTGIGFNVSSDFKRGRNMPLGLRFFDLVSWEYNEFSDDYSGLRDFGCYDVERGLPEIPLRTSTYCERVFIQDTDSVMLGAIVSKDDNSDLIMSFINEAGGEMGNCEYNPHEEEGCIIFAGADEFFTEGYYDVCVSVESPSDYLLYSEDEDEVCGSVLNSGDVDKDYGLWARSAKYEDSSELFIEEDFFETLKEKADSYIASKYLRNCSEGCLLPVKLYGVNQNFVFSDVEIDYRSEGEDKPREEKVYEAEESSAKISYSGILDINSAGFNVGWKGNKSVRVYFEEEGIFSGLITVLPAPIIKWISPRIDIPAGVEVPFIAGVDYDGQIEKYKWEFGDGEVMETEKNVTFHVYKNISSYNLTLTVFSEDGDTTKSFPIIVGAPGSVLNRSLENKKKKVGDVVRKINSFSVWKQDSLEEMTEIVFYQDEIKRLESKLENIYGDDDKIDIALEILELDVPSDVFVSSSTSMPLITGVEEIEPDVIAFISGGDGEGYRDSIWTWQNENIDASVKIDEVSVVRDNSGQEILTYFYSVDVTNNFEDEAYFVIKEDYNDLYFNDEDADKAEDYAYFVLSEGENKKIEFYTDDSEVLFFASPDLSELTGDIRIGACNFNERCETDLGENSDNCRNDCKPLGWLIFWIIVVLIFGLVLYTILQMWYKYNYESKLFRDRKELFNILMFISNARARGKTDKEIRKSLKERKWKGEQIDYAMKKSRGEMTGMYEIIPVEKIFAYFRMNKARKKITTQNMQQGGQNINKQGSQKINRW